MINIIKALGVVLLLNTPLIPPDEITEPEADIDRSQPESDLDWEVRAMQNEMDNSLRSDECGG